MMESGLNLFKSSLYVIAAFLGIEYIMIVALGSMMMADSLLGIFKALKLRQKISMKILAWGIVAKLSLLVIPLLIATMGKGLSFDFTFFVIVTVNILVINEGISCITNILVIKTGKDIKNTDYITMLLNALRNMLKIQMQKLINSIGDKVNEETKPKN